MKNTRQQHAIMVADGWMRAQGLVTYSDLLSLLQDAVNTFGPHWEGDDEWFTFCRAAIAKATGSEA